MSSVQVHVLKGPSALVANSEQVLVTGMTAAGYKRQTLLRLSVNDVLEYVSGKTLGVAGSDWMPPIQAGDACVVLSFKK